ncbi:MAG: DNA-binding protein [Acidobacteria bacterium]|nr:DNA-binding protein [Acidobacteriota bacterium]MBV9477353.1 DNA-binding protein [Acidobacteriota bacterium]
MKKDFVPRHILAEELGVHTQTIAKWERDGWFPQPEHRISDRLILYRRSSVDEAIAERRARQVMRRPPRRVA